MYPRSAEIAMPSTSAALPAARPTESPEPYVVKPREACRLLACGTTRLYELIGAGEIDSFLDGRSRKIAVESIRRYIARRFPANAASTEPQPKRGRGRPRNDDA